MRVTCGDGGLQLVRAWTLETQRGIKYFRRVGDGGGIPERAILIAEQNQIALGIGTSRPPGRVKFHECQESLRLRLVRHELHERAGETDGLVAKALADEFPFARGGIPLVEEG